MAIQKWLRITVRKDHLTFGLLGAGIWRPFSLQRQSFSARYKGAGLNPVR